MKVIETYHLFSEITDKLISLLETIDDKQWNNSTCYPSWKVRDIVAHLIQTSIGRLSIQRDGYSMFRDFDQELSFEDLSGLIDNSNSNWSALFGTVSPGILLDFIKTTEKQLADFILTQDLHSKAQYAVFWAGESESENWFDLGREYTERWHHQQQIRDAVGAESLTEKRYMSPVLQLFMYSVPFWYKSVQADEGTAISIEISGDSGSHWLLSRQNSKWLIEEISAASPNVVSLTEDTAWRFFTRSLPVESFRDKIRLKGNLELLRHFFNVRAIMVND